MRQSHIPVICHFPADITLGIANMRVVHSLLLVVLFGLAVNCSAQEVPPVPDITKQIVRAVQSYANAISCPAGTVSPKSIAALFPYKNLEDRDSAKYAVLWSGDIGCLGGSGSVATQIAIVTVGPNGHFRVVPGLSSPAIKFEGIQARSFPKLVGNTSDTLILDGLDYNPAGGDGMCCPSVLVRVTVRADEKGNWAVVERKPRATGANAQPIVPGDAAR
jgi:hypothetical protein